MVSLAMCHQTKTPRVKPDHYGLGQTRQVGLALQKHSVDLRLGCPAFTVTFGFVGDSLGRQRPLQELPQSLPSHGWAPIQD